MKGIECLIFRHFIHSEESESSVVFRIAYWYLFCLLNGCQWLIIVITKAAGRGTGNNIDIYTFGGDVSKTDLLSLVGEKIRKEEVVAIDCYQETPLFSSFL